MSAPGLGSPVAKPGSATDGQSVLVGLRPEHLGLRPGGAHRVDLTESLGGVSYAYITCPSGEKIVVEERGDHRTSEGDMVDLVIDHDHLYFFDAKTEDRLR